MAAQPVRSSPSCSTVARPTRTENSVSPRQLTATRSVGSTGDTALVSAEQDVIPDEQLYQSWALGDRRAGSRLVDRFVRPIARFFANKIADVADAEELVAET